MKRLFIILFSLTLSTAFAQNDPPSAADIRAGIEGEIKSFNITPQKVTKVIDKALIVSGRDSLHIRIYYGSNKVALPIIYNIHGGALVAGNLVSHDNICRVLANKTQSIVIAIDYAKPPEHPFPAGINDCYDALSWIYKNAAKIGGDAKNIILMGDSGGGLFASALQVKLIGQKSPVKLKAMVLINPAEDLRTPGEGMYGLVTSWYLHGADANDPLVSPILCTDFSKFPPTFIVVCEKDELKPHGLAMAEKLEQAGVKAEILNIPNQDHLGGLWAAAHPEATQAIEGAIAFIKMYK